MTLRTSASAVLFTLSSTCAAPAFAGEAERVCTEIRNDDDKAREWECLAFVGKRQSACRRIDAATQPASRVFCELLYTRVLRGDASACSSLESAGASKARSLHIPPDAVEGQLRPRTNHCKALANRDEGLCSRSADLEDRRACVTTIEALRIADAGDTAAPSVSTGGSTGWVTKALIGGLLLTSGIGVADACPTGQTLLQPVYGADANITAYKPYDPPPSLESGLNPDLFCGLHQIPVDAPSAFDLIGIQPQYVGEENGGVFPTKVKYLDESELREHRVVIKDGKLYDAAGDQPLTGSGQGWRKPIFVMDETGAFYWSQTAPVGRFHHSSFRSGEEVASAGEMEIAAGRITAMSRFSGHYRPTAEIFAQAMAQLEARGVDTSGIEIRGGDPGSTSILAHLAMAATVAVVAAIAAAPDRYLGEPKIAAGAEGSGEASVVREVDMDAVMDDVVERTLDAVDDARQASDQ